MSPCCHNRLCNRPRVPVGGPSGHRILEPWVRVNQSSGLVIGQYVHRSGDIDGWIAQDRAVPVQDPGQNPRFVNHDVVAGQIAVHCARMGASRPDGGGVFGSGDQSIRPIGRQQCAPVPCAIRQVLPQIGPTHLRELPVAR